MKNLLEMAIDATRSNIKVSSPKENVNESLLELLYNQKQKFTKLELIGAICLRRLILQHGEEAVQKMAEDGVLGDAITALNKTVKNGLETSTSYSNNNSSFHYNEKYDKYDLRLESNKYSIVDATKESIAAKKKHFV